jgi:signal transduction histidine kinase
MDRPVDPSHVGGASRSASYPPSRQEQHEAGAFQYQQAIERLIGTVQELSLARDLNTVMAIVRHAARELTGADGATFVLRDGDRCYYADEEAISPLWKGQRFPMKACISGWAMLNRQPAVIEDIYADARIPADAYRPTFVKSLAMVPIRTAAPIGAIGNYWATRRMPTEEQVRILQALADSTSIAMENVQVYTELEERVKARTAQLEALNRELEAFAYSVSHDLRAPLRHIDGFANLLRNHVAATLDEKGRRYLETISGSAGRMGALIDDLLAFSRFGRAELRKTTVNLDQLVRQVVSDLRHETDGRAIVWTIADLPEVQADLALLRQVVINLVGNAVKYTGARPEARIEIGHTESDEEVVVHVRDNGAGFDMQYSDKLFGVFQRLHAAEEFEGTGIGLANVRRIVSRHGGRTWAEGVVDCGATFYFSLPKTSSSSRTDS